MIPLQTTPQPTSGGAWLVDRAATKNLPEALIQALKESQSTQDFSMVPSLSMIEQEALLQAPTSLRDPLEIRRLYGRLGARAASLQHLQWSLPKKLRPEFLKMALLGVSQGSYYFDRYRSTPPSRLQKVTLMGAKATEKKAMKEAQAMADSVWLCRDLINTPAEDMGPEQFVSVAKKVAKESGLKIKVLNEADCKKEKMGALLAVGRASHRKPRIVVLELPGPSKKNFTALCGKGVCFDTGGLGLKPSGGMLLMRKDMGGAATVLAAMRALALNKSKKNIRAYIPLVENAMGPDSFRPGDVLTASDGKTIEVGHTDAEGRLILADAMVYAKKQGAKEIVTVATLTGAAMVALGRIHVPIMGEKSLITRLEKGAKVSGEKVWQLPMDQEHRNLVRGRWADLTNSDGSGEAGCITAGAFLWHFAGDLPFAHCDISPASWKTSPHALGPEGATGVLVSTLVEAFG